MQAGTDSYVSAAEADEYMQSHYRSSAPERTRWAALSDEDKAVLLVMSCSAMERLPVRGRKYELDQPLQFPRLLWGYEPSEDIPEDVKAAQVEYAVWLSNDGKRAEEEQRRNLRRQGLKSFSLGDLSEDYGDGAPAEGTPLACPRAALLLAQYTNGGLGIC